MFDWITGVIARLGYFGVAILTLLENIFPPIPSEVVIPLAGFVAAQGDLRIGRVIATGTLGSLAGATSASSESTWRPDGSIPPRSAAAAAREPGDD